VDLVANLNFVQEVLSFHLISSLKGSINYVSERKGKIFLKEVFIW